MRSFDKYEASYQTLRYCDVSNNAIQANATVFLENIPPNTEQFFAKNNQIYGSFPESMNLPKLRQFDMSSNALSGSLSESLINLPRLRQFNLSHNALSGSLSESLNNLSQLQQLDMSSNALSGKLPDLTESIFTLQELDLSNQRNGFTGPVPDDIGRFQSLKVLNLASNKLAGTIPPSIGNCWQLEVFDLSSNIFISSIPTELGKLEVLKDLDLSTNTLSGVIPSEIGQLRDASILLQGNLFHNASKVAPLSLCTLHSVHVFDLMNDTNLCPIERNALSGIYDSAQDGEWRNRTNWLDEYASCCDWHGVTCDKNTNQVIKLDLSNNGLSGRLSERIGELTSIEVLDLSDNDIQGSIPSEIGLLTKLTYLRLSYNAFSGTAPEGLGELEALRVLQLQSNRITIIPTIPKLDESLSFVNESTFVADCLAPFAFEEPLECENCTLCCNADDECYPQDKTLVAEFGLDYGEFALVLFIGFVFFCLVVVCLSYLFEKSKNRENAPTMSTESSLPERTVRCCDLRRRALEEDDKYALSRIGNDSVYSYLVTDSRKGWLVAFTTLGIQVLSLILFVGASEADLQDAFIDIPFTWKCPRDSEVCRSRADVTNAGWVIFFLLMIANLAKDLINGSKLIYYSAKVRHPIVARIRYLIGGISLCWVTILALYVSTIYNQVNSTNNPNIIVNSVIILFIMDLDEWIFASLKAWNEKWTAHASDSDSKSDSESRSDPEAEKGGAIEEMKEELMLQKDLVAQQNNEIAMLRKTVQQLLESHAAAPTSPESIPQSTIYKSLATRLAESGDVSSDKVTGEREAMNKMEDENSAQKGLLIASQSQRDVTLSHFVEQKEEESHSDADSGSAYSF